MHTDARATSTSRGIVAARSMHPARTAITRAFASVIVVTIPIVLGIFIFVLLLDEKLATGKRIRELFRVVQRILEFTCLDDGQGQERERRDEVRANKSCPLCAV